MRKVQTCFFKSVKALPDHKLEVEMGTDAHIDFDFTSRLGAVRFYDLNDEDVFNTASTDGLSIIFKKDDEVRVVISADMFMDLVLIDRTGEYPLL